MQAERDVCWCLNWGCWGLIHPTCCCYKAARMGFDGSHGITSMTCQNETMIHPWSGKWLCLKGNYHWGTHFWLPWLWEEVWTMPFFENTLEFTMVLLSLPLFKANMPSWKNAIPKKVLYKFPTNQSQVSTRWFHGNFLRNLFALFVFHMWILSSWILLS